MLATTEMPSSDRTQPTGQEYRLHRRAAYGRAASPKCQGECFGGHTTQGEANSDMLGGAGATKKDVARPDKFGESPGKLPCLTRVFERIALVCTVVCSTLYRTSSCDYAGGGGGRCSDLIYFVALSQKATNTLQSEPRYVLFDTTPEKHFEKLGSEHLA